MKHTSMTYLATITDTPLGAMVRVAFPHEGVTYVVERSTVHTDEAGLNSCIREAAQALRQMIKPLAPEAPWTPRMASRSVKSVEQRLSLG